MKERAYYWIKNRLSEQHEHHHCHHHHHDVINARILTMYGGGLSFLKLYTGG